MLHADRYWICQRNKGAVPRTLEKFKHEREHYRALGDEPMSQALKVMMNSIYGLFGSDGIFEFQDYRAAELVTSFARLKLLEMKELANKQFDMNIIYGDNILTDRIITADIPRRSSRLCKYRYCLCDPVVTPYLSNPRSANIL